MSFEPGQILKAYESEALAAEVVELFAAQARPLVKQGVDVLIREAASRCCSSRRSQAMSWTALR